MLERAVILSFFVALLSACQSYSASSTLPPPHVIVVSRTPPPSPTARPTATRTVWQAIQPYTIIGLRKHDFQGGELRVFGKLEETDIYTRYLIDYPSDGLTITGIMQVPVEGHPPFPVIVMNHGFFARSVFHSGDGTDRAAEYLNKHGYLTIASDYRSWGGSEAGPAFITPAWSLTWSTCSMPSRPFPRPTQLASACGGIAWAAA